MKNNKGITITSLIVTIIVMVILAGIALLFSVGDSGVISRAEKTQFLEDMKLYKEELELYKGERQIQNQKEDEPLNKGIGDDFNEDDPQRIKDNYIPSMKRKYFGKLKIEKGKLVFISSGDEEEDAMAEAAGLEIEKINVNIEVEIQGQGTVEGLPQNGEAIIGETINLKAMAGNLEIDEQSLDYEFVGWYSKDEKLLSREVNYSFIAESDVKLIAKFATDVTIIHYSDENGEKKVLLDSKETLSKYTNRTDITKIEIGRKCKVIPQSAFEGCTNLKEVVILTENILTVNSFAFRTCSSLEKINLPKVTFATYDGGKQFMSCSKLTNITIGSEGNPVSSMATSAMFRSCGNSKAKIKIYIQDSVTSLQYEPWEASIATIEYYNATTGVLVNKIIGQEYKGNTEIAWTEIPDADKITKIRANAFQGCTNLALTSLPEKLTAIENYTFENCANLEITELPENLTKIGTNAFYNCSKIKITQIPEKVTTIGVDAFNGCTGLEQVTTSPNNSILLNKGAFSNCTGLETLIISNMTWGERWDSTFIGNCTNLKDLQLGSLGKPMSTVYKYSLNKCSRNDLTVKIFVESGVTRMSSAPFGATNATIVYKDATTGEIVGESLGKRYAGTDVNFTQIPNSDIITDIRASAFEGCTNLALTSLPANLVTIGEKAFYGCTNIKISQIPEKVTTIGTDAFNGCTGLEQVKTSPNNSILLDKRAFSNCTGLTSLVIANMTWGGDRWDDTFISNCYNLTSLQLGSLGHPMETVYKYSLSNSGRDAEKLTITVYLEDGVTSVGSALFGAKNAVVVYKNATTDEVIE